MSQDFVQDTQLQAGSVEIFRSLLETLVSILRDFNEDSSTSSSSDLLDILKGLKEVYESTVNEVNKREHADVVASGTSVACSAIYGFINKTFSGK